MQEMRERPTLFDAALVVVLLGLGGLLMVGNINGSDDGLRIDSHSWWALPVFLAAIVPLLWWRRHPTLAVGAAVTAMALHVVLFGFMVRCGAGLPLTWAAAYLVGTRDGVRRSLAGLALAEVLLVAVLIRDSAAGPELIPAAGLIAAGLWGVGRLVHRRSAMVAELERRNAELQSLRDARAALEVSHDRARLSAELDSLLDVRLAQLSQLAVDGSQAEPHESIGILATIETDSRAVLAEMREIVGELRGGEVALTPAPSVVHLDALLARRDPDGARLRVEGDPRALPTSIELSAYRIVEHVLGVLQDDPATPVEVRLRFEDEAMEISLSGRSVPGADVRAAVARARERVSLQHGRLTAKVARGRVRVVAQMPLGV